jgi:DNA-binding transcriptional MerR regulator
MAESDKSADDEGLLSIGELINDLREEFPDVSISKVRFLESQGLLAPARSDGGYRLFDPSDVDRLRFILRQQRDHFLPLKVIKSKLTLWERGEEVDDTEPRDPHRLLDHRSEPLTETEVVRRSGSPRSNCRHSCPTGCWSSPRRRLPAGGARRGIRGPPSVRPGPRAPPSASGQARRRTGSRRHRPAERAAAAHSQPGGREQARNVVESTGESMIALHRALLAAELRDLLE